MNLAFDREQRSQQAPHVAVAVEKSMDGFELIVGEGNGDLRRQLRGVDEFLPVRKAKLYFGGRRRNEAGRP